MNHFSVVGSPTFIATSLEELEQRKHTYPKDLEGDGDLMMESYEIPSLMRGFLIRIFPLPTQYFKLNFRGLLVAA